MSGWIDLLIKLLLTKILTAKMLEEFEKRSNSIKTMIQWGHLHL